jgi:TRAP-type C4-dicarboxylate transport system permease small subunit
VVILVFLVQPWLEAADEQLTIGILGSRLKNEALKKVIFIVRGIITVVIFYYLVQFGIYVAEKAYVNKTVTYVLQFPRYILYAITTGIFGLVILEWLAVIFVNKGEKISC